MNPSIFPATAAGSRPSLSLRALFPAILVAVLSPAAMADDFYWNIDGDGDWTEPANWYPSGGPPGAGDIAYLGDPDLDISADRVITLDADWTVGGLVIGDRISPYYSCTLSGANTLSMAGAATILKPLDTASQAHDVIAVPVTLGGNLTIDQKSRGSVLEFSGSIGNDGSPRNVTLFGNGANSLTNFAMVIFSSANSYGGTTTIGTGGGYAGGAGNGSVLRITHSQALGTGNVAITGGMNTPRLELAGGIIVSNNITSVNGSDNENFRPRLASVGGANEWAGNITGITTGGGNYPIHSTGTAPGDFFTISGNIVNQRTQTETRNLRFGGAGAGEVTGRIEDGTSGSAWNVFKDDAGTWAFSNASNTYRGTTTVNAGTLVVDGTHDGSGAYTVAAGATLEVNGSLSNIGVNVNVNGGATLTGSGTISGWVFANGTVAPGNGVGTLTTGTIFLGTYSLEIDGEDADKLVVDGDLDLDGATLSISELSPAAESGYVIATCTGEIIGTFLDVPPGYEVDTTSTPGEVILVKLPGTAYDTWIDTFPSLTGDDRDPGADPDGDGVANILEFVLNGDPTASDTSILPSASVSGDNLVIVFERRDDSASITELKVQHAPDLAAWTDVMIGATSGSSGGATYTVEKRESAPDLITVTIPTGGNPSYFARLSATGLP